MKLILDTDAKTISLYDKISLNDFFEHLIHLFPNETWKEYTLLIEPAYQYQKNKEIVYIPIFEPPIHYPQPFKPYPTPYFYGLDTTANKINMPTTSPIDLNNYSGTVCIEIVPTRSLGI